MGKIYDHIQSGSEWLVALVMIVGGITLLFADPVTTGGPITQMLGSKGAGIVYSVVFVSAGTTLVLGKALKKKRLHKYGLLAIYLISIFTFILEVAIIGWQWYLLDSVAIFIITGWAWLRWKFKTEYLDPKEFMKEYDELGPYPRP